MSGERQYIAIDLKSFYASVECVERGLDPLDACLVVADESRTDKTICLAVSPSLKAFGVGGRPRLFEVVQRVREVNEQRGNRGSSRSGKELVAHPELRVDYHVARPRMGLYIAYSAKIYSIYLRFIAPEDIHVYSIDEVFIDATPYLRTYKMTSHELAMTMIRAVLRETGITATAGISTNMYLCKVAMDIVAKKMAPDSDGVRIAELDTMSYRQKLWSHTPLTDFWRVGHGTASRLAQYGITTMGDIARCSLAHEDLLYHLLGINAELLIDHAWGREPVTMAQVKAYRPEAHSLSSSQVLASAYSYDKARNVALEMADMLALDMVAKGVVTDQISLGIGYDNASLRDPEIRNRYHGRISVDHYGRPVPAHGHASINLKCHTSSAKKLSAAIEGLWRRTALPFLLVRRISLSANHVVHEARSEEQRPTAVQLELFADYDNLRRQKKAEMIEMERERRRQQAVLTIKGRFGKNSILKGLNYTDGATQRERNCQIGGHSA